MHQESTELQEANRSSDTSMDGDVERSKVAILRTLVQREDPSAKDQDVLMLRRFLRYRDFDIEKARNLLSKCFEWRRAFVLNGSISPSEISDHLAQNKAFMQGFDRKRRPILVVFGSRHNGRSRGLEEFKSFVAYSLDKICSRIPGEQEKFGCIVDLKGWGYGNSDIRGYLAALSILQECYPEILGKLYMVHVPRIFTAAWKMLYPLIDKNTKRKIIFVEDKQLSETLLGDVEDSELPDLYGGKLALVPIQDA